MKPFAQIFLLGMFLCPFLIYGGEAGNGAVLVYPTNPPTTVNESPKPKAQPRPETYGYVLGTRSPERLVQEIMTAIAATPVDSRDVLSDHLFNLAVTYSLLLHPPDIDSARSAYNLALAFGAKPDLELERALK